MPWGKHRGVEIRLLPEAYLSFLAGWLNDPDRREKFWWLRESLIAELTFRGLDAEQIDRLEVPEDWRVTCAVCHQKISPGRDGAVISHSSYPGGPACVGSPKDTGIPEAGERMIEL
jgi:hypothetical protein